MIKTLAKISYNGTYKIIYDGSRQINQFGLYYVWYDNGYHTNLVRRYADMQSCLAHVMDIMNNDHTNKIIIEKLK